MAPLGLAALRSAIPCWLEDAENGLTVLFRSLLHGLWEDLRRFDERIATMDAEVDRIAKSDPVAQRLQQLRGVGPYLRSILIHGARWTVAHAKNKEDRLSLWMTGLAQRIHLNVAAVALANKTVRMAWAMMRNEADYDPDYVTA